MCASAGIANWSGRLSTFDLLIKVACFVTKVNNVFNKKWAYLNELVQGGQRTEPFPYVRVPCVKRASLLHFWCKLQQKRLYHTERDIKICIVDSRSVLLSLVPPVLVENNLSTGNWSTHETGHLSTNLPLIKWLSQCNVDQTLCWPNVCRPNVCRPNVRRPNVRRSNVFRRNDPFRCPSCFCRNKWRKMNV